MAVINFNNKRNYLGTFATIEEARKSYLLASEKVNEFMPD